MGMDWLKGLVGPVAQFSPGGEPMAPQGYGAPAYGAPPASPPMGGAPQASPPAGAWGPPPGAWDPNGGHAAAPNYSAPPAYTAPSAGAWGSPAAAPSATTSVPVSNVDARVLQLENKCEELRRDLESVALFAQTLLAVLDDKKVMNQQDFQDMKRKLDLLDGRLDDRIGKP